MNFINIFLLTSLSIWLAMLILFGLLAFVYQTKHRPYLLVLKELQNEIFKNIDFKLESISNDQLELLQDEILYLDNFYTRFSVEKKLQKKVSLMKKNADFLSDLKVDKIYFSLRHHQKFIFEKKCAILISNMRILIDNDDTYLQVPLDQIKFYDAKVISTNEGFKKILKIVTNENIYLFLLEDVKMFLIIKTLKDG